MIRNKKRSLEVAIFCIFTVILGLHFFQTYQANKNFDELFYAKDSNGNYYRFDMTEEAKQEPVFFHRWSCAVNIEENPPFMDCKHCMIGGFKCSEHAFFLDPVMGEEKEMMENKVLQQSKKNLWIMLVSVFLMLCSLAYWGYLWRYKYDEWLRTPFGKAVIWIKNRMEDEHEINRKY